MESHDDEVIAICSKENLGNTIGVWVSCRKCNADIWLSDSTSKSWKLNYPEINMDEHPPMTLCIECGLKHMAEDMEEPQIFPLTDEQIDEAIKGL